MPTSTLAREPADRDPHDAQVVDEVAVDPQPRLKPGDGQAPDQKRGRRKHERGELSHLDSQDVNRRLQIVKSALQRGHRGREKLSTAGVGQIRGAS